MKTPPRRISTPRHIVCPGCGLGQLWSRGPEVASCDSCGLSVGGTIFRALEQIAALPDALGVHACEECGHPEMRRLPDEVYHCPACGSEVLPIEAPLEPKRTSLGSASAWGEEAESHPSALTSSRIYSEGG
jgi:ribosomal protein L37AE/L43A